eukprot:TRINITY_DN5594_c0_g2_i1.p1 TRINITY_DN5594_c0_g2~~TRINITY_DN5594_c0_g2_i1.p1  ORF type:complete len:1854 (+),score=413.69 TRINITY_DN5594_c0_g2_i1:55-5616(+)
MSESVHVFRAALLRLHDHNARMTAAARFAKEDEGEARRAVAALRAGRSDTWEGLYAVVAAMTLKDADALAVVALEETTRSYHLRTRAVQALAKFDQRRLYRVLLDEAICIQLRRFAMELLAYVPPGEADMFFTKALGAPAWGGAWRCVYVLARLQGYDGSSEIITRWFPHCRALALYEQKAGALFYLGAAGKEKVDMGKVHQSMAERRADELIATLPDKNASAHHWDLSAGALARQRPDALAAALCRRLDALGCLAPLLRGLLKHRPQAALEVFNAAVDHGAVAAIRSPLLAYLPSPRGARMWRDASLRDGFFALVAQMVALDHAARADTSPWATIVIRLAAPRTVTESSPTLARDYDRDHVTRTAARGAVLSTRWPCAETLRRMVGHLADKGSLAELIGAGLPLSDADWAAVCIATYDRADPAGWYIRCVSSAPAMPLAAARHRRAVDAAVESVLRREGAAAALLACPQFVTVQVQRVGPVPHVLLGPGLGVAPAGVVHLPAVLAAARAFAASAGFVKCTATERCGVLQLLPLCEAEGTLRGLAISSDPTNRTAALEAMWAAAVAGHEAADVCRVARYVVGRLTNESESVKAALTARVFAPDADSVKLWCALDAAGAAATVRDFGRLLVKWGAGPWRATALAWACMVCVLGPALGCSEGLLAAVDSILALPAPQKQEPDAPTVITALSAALHWVRKEGARAASLLAEVHADRDAVGACRKHLRAILSAAVAAADAKLEQWAPATFTVRTMHRHAAHRDAVREGRCGRDTAVAKWLTKQEYTAAEIVDIANFDVAMGLAAHYGAALTDCPRGQACVARILAGLTTVAPSSHAVMDAMALALFGLTPRSTAMIRTAQVRRRADVLRMHALSCAAEKPMMFLMTWAPFTGLVERGLQSLASSGRVTPGLCIAGAFLRRWPYGRYCVLGRGLAKHGVGTALAYEVAGWYVPCEDTVLRPCLSLLKNVNGYAAMAEAVLHLVKGGYAKLKDAGDYGLRAARRWVHAAPIFEDILSAGLNTTTGSDVHNYAAMLQGPASPPLERLRMAALRHWHDEFGCFTRALNWRPPMKALLGMAWMLGRSVGARPRYARGGRRAVKARSCRRADSEEHNDLALEYMRLVEQYVPAYGACDASAWASHAAVEWQGRKQTAAQQTACGAVVSALLKAIAARKVHTPCMNPRVMRFVKAAGVYDEVVVARSASVVTRTAWMTFTHRYSGAKDLAKALLKQWAEPHAMVTSFTESRELLVYLAERRQDVFAEVLQLVKAHAAAPMGHAVVAQLRRALETPAHLPTMTFAPSSVVMTLPPGTQRLLHDVCCIPQDEVRHPAGLAFACSLPSPDGIPPLDAAEHPVNVLLAGVAARQVEYNKRVAADPKYTTSSEGSKAGVAVAQDAACAAQILTALTAADDQAAAARVAAAHVDTGAASKASVLTLQLTLRCVPQPAAGRVLGEVLGRRSTKAAGRTQLTRAAVQLLTDQPDAARAVLAQEFDPAGGEGSETTWVDVGEEASSTSSALGATGPAASTKVMALGALLSSPLLGSLPAYADCLEGSIARQAAGTGTADDEQVVEAALRILAGTYHVKTLNAPMWPLCAPDVLPGAVASLLSSTRFGRLAREALQKWTQAAQVDVLPGGAVSAAGEPIVHALTQLTDLDGTENIIACLTAHGWDQLPVALVERRLAVATSATAPRSAKGEALASLHSLCTEPAFLRGIPPLRQQEVFDALLARVAAEPLTAATAFGMLGRKLSCSAGDEVAVVLRHIAALIDSTSTAHVSAARGAVLKAGKKSEAWSAAQALAASPRPLERYVAACLAVHMASLGRDHAAVGALLRPLEGDEICSGVVAEYYIAAQVEREGST